MRTPTRGRRGAFMLAIVAILVGGRTDLVHSQDLYPSAPIKMVVPFPPGGVTDSVARMVAPMLSKRLNQPVVIDSRGGASGNIGIATVARSSPDGYTILFTTDALSKNPSVYKNAGFDPIKDFVPIGMVGTSPLLLLSSMQFEPSDIAGLVKYAKDNPTKVNYATTGIGSAAHLLTRVLENEAHVKLTHVPYKGGGPAFTDLMANHVQVIFSTVTSAMPLVEGKRAKVIGIASKSRVTQWPNVQTFSEQGYPGVDMQTWLAVLVPAGTSQVRSDRLRDALHDVVTDPEFVKKADELGFLAKFTGPADFSSHLRTEIARWGDLVRKENITAE